MLEIIDEIKSNIEKKESIQKKIVINDMRFDIQQ